MISLICEIIRIYMKKPNNSTHIDVERTEMEWWGTESKMINGANSVVTELETILLV